MHTPVLSLIPAFGHLRYRALLYGSPAGSGVARDSGKRYNLPSQELT